MYMPPFPAKAQGGLQEEKEKNLKGQLEWIKQNNKISW